MSETTLSLNEVETLAAKAARGAGLGWGQAEEIGRAARWLAARQIAWASPLLALLDDKHPGERLAPAFHAADRSAGSADGDNWSTEPCDPLWLVPLVATALYGGPLLVRMQFGEVEIAVGGDALAGATPALAALPQQPARIAVEAADPIFAPVRPGQRRATLEAAERVGLERLAALTYVPASASSRASGAGGGRVDDE